MKFSALRFCLDVNEFQGSLLKVSMAVMEERLILSQKDPGSVQAILKFSFTAASIVC